MSSGLWFMAVIGVLLVAVIWLARKWGGAAVEKDFFEESHDKAVEARKIDHHVDGLSDDELNDRLRGDK